ncbi:MAG: ABC transporter permease, partial [Anaerolineae bacterium]|nr:ABC transporter permease [Anaerolineae bacterium]
MATRSAAVPLRSFFASIRNARWLAVLGGILLLGLAFSQLSPAFLQFRNLQNIIVQASVTGVMAIGMTFVIMTAGIDISVGGILYLTLVLATALSLRMEASGETAGAIVYIAAMVLGAILGLFNGLLINYVGINPLVVTLATLTVYRGLAIHINKAGITIPPESARFLGIGKVYGVPVPLIMAILVTAIGALVLSRTRFGRYALAIGASSTSAYESGLPMRAVLIAVYVIAGFCAGLAGLIMMGRVGAVQTDMGIGIEFTVITAVVLGGTLLSGGRASMLGSLLGAILLVMIDNGLNLIHASAFIYDIVRGAVLIGAVLIDRASSL